MPAATAKTNNAMAFNRSKTITLDSNGDVPTRFELFSTFDLPNSIKGDFAIKTENLKRVKQNFDAGIGFPTEDASTGIPVDYEHKPFEKAAGWIKGMELAIDPVDPARATLYANPVEWTAEAAEAIRDGRYKMISPSGNFGTVNGKQSMWINLNNMQERIPDVCDGAGLTNLPFQRHMSAIRASMAEDDEGVQVTKDNQQVREKSMLNIDEVRLMKREELSVPQLDFLAENKEKLSADELKRFKLDMAADQAATDGKLTLSAEDAKTLADIREGRLQLVGADKAIVEKQTLDALQSTADQYRTEKAETVVDSHIKTGRIKMDSRDFWVKTLLDASPDARKAFEDQLSALPANENLDKKIGNGQEIDADVQEELKKKTLSMQEKAKGDGETLSYAQAQDKVLQQDADIKARAEAARAGK